MKEIKPKYMPLPTLFRSLQRQMSVKLESARECLEHPGVKGDTSEDAWRNMLSEYLPKRYCVEKAQVIDHEGRVSQQLDIVIYDRQYSPFIFRQDSGTYIPAESVYAVIEAKQELDKGMIEYASEKAQSVRELKRTSANFRWVHGDTKRQELFSIASGIVALSSSWSPPLGESFRSVMKSVGESPVTRIDFGCAISGGSFDVSYNENHEPNIVCCDGKLSLMTFFLKLLARLQSMGTVPAIDINSYLAGMNTDPDACHAAKK